MKGKELSNLLKDKIKKVWASKEEDLVNNNHWYSVLFNFEVEIICTIIQNIHKEVGGEKKELTKEIIIGIKKEILEARISKHCRYISDDFLEVMREGSDLEDIEHLETIARMVSTRAFRSVIWEINNMLEEYNNYGINCFIEAKKD